jgi:hypothetical protein
MSVIGDELDHFKGEDESRELKSAAGPLTDRGGKAKEPRLSDAKVHESLQSPPLMEGLYSSPFELIYSSVPRRGAQLLQIGLSTDHTHGQAPP